MVESDEHVALAHDVSGVYALLLYGTEHVGVRRGGCRYFFFFSYKHKRSARSVSPRPRRHLMSCVSRSDVGAEKVPLSYLDMLLTVVVLAPAGGMNLPARLASARFFIRRSAS